jgi:hypothetical protein
MLINSGGRRNRERQPAGFSALGKLLAPKRGRFQLKKKGVLTMANENDNRVLSRRNARVVTTEEAVNVTGGAIPHTVSVCTFDLRVARAGGSGRAARSAA